LKPLQWIITVLSLIPLLLNVTLVPPLSAVITLALSPVILGVGVIYDYIISPIQAWIKSSKETPTSQSLQNDQERINRPNQTNQTQQSLKKQVDPLMPQSNRSRGNLITLPGPSEMGIFSPSSPSKNSLIQDLVSVLESEEKHGLWFSVSPSNKNCHPCEIKLTIGGSSREQSSAVLWKLVNKSAPFTEKSPYGLSNMGINPTFEISTAMSRNGEPTDHQSIQSITLEAVRAMLVKCGIEERQDNIEARQAPSQAPTPGSSN
jgi:hypothetical protein